MLFKIEKTLINHLRVKFDSNCSKEEVENVKSEQQIKEPIDEQTSAHWISSGELKTCMYKYKIMK